MLNGKTLHCPVCRIALRIRKRTLVRNYRNGQRNADMRYLWCQECEIGYRIQRIWLYAGQWQEESLLEARLSLIESVKNMERRMEKGELPPVVPSIPDRPKMRPKVTAAKRPSRLFEELKKKYLAPH